MLRVCVYNAEMVGICFGKLLCLSTIQLVFSEILKTLSKKIHNLSQTVHCLAQNYTQPFSQLFKEFLDGYTQYIRVPNNKANYIKGFII